MEFRSRSRSGDKPFKRPANRVTWLDQGAWDSSRCSERSQRRRRNGHQHLRDGARGAATVSQHRGARRHRRMSRLPRFSITNKSPAWPWDNLRNPEIRTVLVDASARTTGFEPPPKCPDGEIEPERRVRPDDHWYHHSAGRRHRGRRFARRYSCSATASLCSWSWEL